MKMSLNIKRFCLFILSFLGLSLIIFTILKIFPYYTNEIKTKNLALLASLISFLVLIIFKSSLPLLSSYLLKIYISIISAIFFTIILMLILAEIFNLSFLLITCIIFIFGFLINFFISLKKTIKGLYLLISLSILSFFALVLFSEIQKATIKEYQKKFEEIGFTFNLNKLIPYENKRAQCKELLDMVKPFADEKNEKWGSFYNNYALSFSEIEFLNSLKEGKIPEKQILSDPKKNDKIWDEFLSYNFSIKKAMEKCPYIQLYDPEEYKDKLEKAPMPDYLSLIRISRILYASYIILKAKGKDADAEENLKEIYEITQKLNLKGQPIISTLINIAIKRIYLLSEAISTLIEKKPFPPEKLKRIEDVSFDAISLLLSSYNSEIYLIFFKNPKKYEEIDFYINKKIILHLPEFFIRAFSYKKSKKHLDGYYKICSFLSQKVKTKENKFFWKEFRKLNLEELTSFPNLYLSPYGRILALFAQSKLLLLSNEIIKFYKENKKLPESIDFLSKNNFIDPFSEKPLIYKKLDDKKFVVYSVFYDGKDDGGKNLFISGAIAFKDDLKEDLGFTFSLE